MNPKAFEQLTIQQISKMIDSHILQQKKIKIQLLKRLKSDQPPSKKSELVELFE
jgi:hypothetical protein